MEGEYGADIWVADLERKILNMQKLIKSKTKKPQKAFPEGTPVTISLDKQKKSSV